MNRNQKLKINILTGLLSQIVTLVCGFVIPWLILNYYGSEVNGLVYSVAHFLSFISLAECGVGAVVQSALYKPLAEKDEDSVSRIIISSDRFFRRIGFILLAYVAVLSVTYPLIVNSSYDFWYTCSLILAISISSFAQYFFCMSYRLILTADQLGYIQLGVQILSTIFNTVLCLILARAGASIQVFKLGTSLVFLIQPILVTLYANKHYRINKKLKLTEEPIKQKWNGFSQHVAYVVLGNTDTVVLTLLSTLSNVSIYNIYYLVLNGIKCLIMAAITGVQSLFGNMYAKEENELLSKVFSFYEWVMHTGIVFLFTCAGVLIVPFVQVYTKGITDADYIVPVFAALLTLAQASYCLRLPYNTMVFAAGHYKQTQLSALIEAGLNIVLSVTFVFKFGLIGVAIGTFVAMTYRTVYLAWYLKGNIINRPIKHFLKHIVVDTITAALSFATTFWLSMTAVSYAAWILLAIKVALIILAICVLVNLIFYRDMLSMAFKRMRMLVPLA